jgi:GNAT superfamily N-acetyltransferase
MQRYPFARAAMRISRKPKFPQSQLLGARFEVPNVGLVRVALPLAGQVQSVDREWPADRELLAPNAHWRWKDILAGLQEKFAVLTDGDEVAALWCSKRSQPIRLEGQPHYRLDYLEVHPKSRGAGLGLAVFAIICWRAVELGAKGMVLGALPGAVPFYKHLGVAERRPRGWHVATGLVAMTVDGPTLARYKEYADGLQDES